MPLYYNLHTHSSQSIQGEFRLVNHFLQDDFVPQSGIWYSIGVHPWHVHQIEGDYIKKLSEEALDKQVIAIGECGLDRAIATPIEAQQTFFEAQIEVSEALQLPVIIHCVKAYEMLLPIRKKLKAKQPWILHGYKGNEQSNALFLHDPDIYFSYGKWLFNESSGFPAIFVTLPLERVFLETDTSDYRIDEIYQQAALLRGITKEEIINQVGENFKKVFGDVGKSLE